MPLSLDLKGLHELIPQQQYLEIEFYRSFLFLDLPDDGPVITGGFPRYHIGDKVNVNCTSYRSKPAAKLRWYINGEQADFALTKNFPVTIFTSK